MIVGDLSLSTPSPDGPPADSDLIQVEWWAIPPAGPAVVLSEVTDFAISGIAGSRGAISVTVPLRSTTHDLLMTHTVLADRDLEVEIRLFGGAAQSLRGYLQESDADDVAESGSRTWTGCLVAGLLYEAELYPVGPDVDEKGETHFAAKNAGEIVKTLVQLAQTRGALAGITTSTFNTAQDSNEVAWTTNTTIALSPGSLYGELLEEFEELGLCEWEVTGAKELKLYVPGTRGVNRTTGPTPTALHRGRDLTDAPRKHSVRNSPTVLLAVGKEGLYREEVDASALARRGRRIEAYASAGQVTNLGALTAYAQTKLATLTPGALELSLGLVVNGEGPQPFLDVQLGDWVWCDTGKPGGAEALRVQQVSLARSGNDLTAAAVVGTLSMSLGVALTRRLNRLERGDTVVGTSAADPGDLGPDSTPPSAPVGLVAESFAYQEKVTGGTYARVDLGWQAVTTDADGSNAPLVLAAKAILERIQSEEEYFEDWTWVGKPDVVGTYAADLRALYAGDTLDEAASVPWLQNYIVTNIGTPTATDDIAGYRVRHAYVGINQVGGLPSSDPFSDDLLPYVDDGTTTATSMAIGGVGAGVDVRFEVAAFDNDGNYSSWSNPLIFTTEIDNTPPPVTSTPILSAGAISVTLTWDGLTADGIDMFAAAPDTKHIELHLSPSATPTSDDPTTYQTTLKAAGSWPVYGVSFDVGYYAWFVAVDQADNRSAPSAVAGPATPRKLVQIELGADAVGRLQIIDGEIVNAKIADLAVNNAKISDLSVEKLVTGTLFADVTLSGIIRTSNTGARSEIDAAGIRLYNAINPAPTVNLSALDGTALITGTYKSAPDGTGKRINILPEGTFRIYPVAGTNYSEIANFGNDVVWRGPLDVNGRSGRFNVNVQGAALNFSSESEIPSNLRSEVAVFDRRVRITAPLTHFQINGKLSPVDGSPRRIQFSQTNAAGTDIGSSFISYRMSSSGSGGWTGNGGGIKFETGQVLVTSGDFLDGFGVIKASDFATASSLEVKTDVVPLAESLGMSAADLVQAVAPISFAYEDGVAVDGVRHIGLAVEHVAPYAPELVIGWDKPAKDRSLSGMGVAAVAWGAAADAHIGLARLTARVAALEAKLAA